MSDLVNKLASARADVSALEERLNARVERILLLLISLVDSEKADAYENGLWWWYGDDDSRPFRRGDRHGYFYTHQDQIPVYLDEPDISILGFDAYDRADLMGTSEKRIPIAYLEMDDLELINDAMTRIIAKRSDMRDRAQALADVKKSAMAKLTEAEKRALGL